MEFDRERLTLMTKSNQKAAAMVEASEYSDTSLPSDRVFRIALSMSGATSAGAYTAGVFDFLMQALAEMEQARGQGEADAPNHQVRIVAMTGASAGGITAALGTIALGYGLVFEADATSSSRRKPTRKHALDGYTIDCVLPSLYEAWVVKPRMVGITPDVPCLLSTEDLAQSPLRSLLNASVLDNIRNTALEPPPELAMPSTLPPVLPHSFLAEPLHLYLTISNVAGIPYEVRGNGPQDAYHMLNHADRLHFRASGIGGDVRVASDWARPDPAIALDRAALVTTGGGDAGWQLLGDGALATAAFPGGLSARLLTAQRIDYKHRQFPAPEYHCHGVGPDWPKTAKWPDPFHSVHLDGGMINNDPFDYARYSILKDWRDKHAHNKSNVDCADRAVLMISPFPERPVPALLPDTGLIALIGALFPLLLQQARFKLADLLAAADPHYASRWLIAPRRTDDLNVAPSSVNIACGLLSGFGGFLDQRFREHDFQLGRRNCQAFLKNWKQSKFTPGSSAPVVPLYGSAAREVLLPKWPKMSEDDFRILIRRIGDRIGALLCALARDERRRGCWSAWFWGPALKLVWWCGGRLLLLNRLHGKIYKILVERRQI